MRKNIKNTISGKTGIIAHIGYPTTTFTAPMILNPCFETLKAQLVVIPMACKAEDLSRLMNGLLRLENFVGALITMPHKQKILQYLKFKSHLVDLSSSCNILKLNKSREVVGEMYDSKGLLNVMYERGVNLQGASILLIGAGGVGSAIAFSLGRTGVNKLTIKDLDYLKSAQLCKKIKKFFPKILVNIWDGKETDLDIIINASPAGMKAAKELPIAINQIKSAEVVADFVLTSSESSLINIARKNGSKVISGNDILMAQIPEILNFFGLKKISIKTIKTISNF